MLDKKWEEYSKEEKTTYLVNWFHYYGNLIYTFEELEKFQKLAETRQDDIFDHIVTRFLFQQTIQSGLLLQAMRQGQVDKLFKTNIREKDLKAGKDLYEQTRLEITNEITGSNKEDEDGKQL